MKQPKNRLRLLRAERRLNQLDTALASRISASRYWRIENGYTQPTDAERATLARVLKTDVATAFPEAAAS
jgi:transcriptional regulator with XRE-family HTH domain